MSLCRCQQHPLCYLQPLIISIPTPTPTLTISIPFSALLRMTSPAPILFSNPSSTPHPSQTCPSPVPEPCLLSWQTHPNTIPNPISILGPIPCSRSSRNPSATPNMATTLTLTPNPPQPLLQILLQPQPHYFSNPFSTLYTITLLLKLPIFPCPQCPSQPHLCLRSQSHPQSILSPFSLSPSMHGPPKPYPCSPRGPLIQDTQWK